MSKDAPVIELSAISLSFGSLELLQNFHLKLWEGDSLVLVGPSGSGKSSLLKLMAGLLQPSRGEVLFRGGRLSTLSKKAQDQFISEVGMLFQQNALFDSMTVFENLDFVLRELKPEMTAKERAVESERTLDAVGLAHVLNHFPSEMSGGMQKRLGIARALVVKPRLVFYDDPTAGLDPITSRQMIEMILDLQKKWGGTLVTVTHDMMRAYQLAGRCMVCFHGDFVETGNAQETREFQDPRVQQFIHGRTEGPLGAL